MAHIHRVGPTDLVYAPVTLSSSVPAATINQGDLVAMISNKVVAAASYTWTTDTATTQTNFAAAFVGMSTGRSRIDSTDPLDLELPIQMDGTIEFDAVSASYTIGQYLGCAKDTGNNLKQTVEGVATKARAIAIVVKDSGASATKVLARLINTPVKR
jgi:hypothetical protein